MSVIKMACRAQSVSANGGRCRNVAGSSGVCSQHADASLAEAPWVILFRIRASKREIPALEEAGCGWQDRNEEVLEERHREEGEGLGRNIERYGDPKRGRVDTGCPVFNSTSPSDHFLPMVSCKGLFEELMERGYRVAHIHLYQKEYDKRKGTGWLSVKLIDPTKVHIPLGNMEPLMAAETLLTKATWAKVHVWANEPKEGGKIVHTVNVKERQDGAAPQHALVFDGGHWNYQTR